MKKPYMGKIGEISKFKIWRVNGQYIREKLDEEFTNFGQHYRFNFIPEDEFWIDNEHADDESHFFIDHMLIEYRLMESGLKYPQAIEEADKIETRERQKVKLIKELQDKKNESEIIKKIHKKLLKKYSQKIKVWIVNGDIVRSIYNIDFTEGGHDKVYKFVPKNEVWLDDDLSIREMKFVLLHEMHERNLMAKGWSYNPGKIPKNEKNKKVFLNSAHYDSSKIEYYCRHHPKETDKHLQKEITISNTITD